MDDSSVIRSMRQELHYWSRRRHMYRGARSMALSLYDRMARRVHWRTFRFRGRVCLLNLAGHDDPFAVRLGSSDSLVLEEIFLYRDYDNLPQGIADSTVRQVVDLGSNAGYSLRLWRSMFPDAMLIGVEPDQQNMSMCRHNMLLAGDDGSALSLVQACAAGSSRQVHLCQMPQAWSYTMNDHPTQRSTSVPAMTMPQILEKAGALPVIDLLKCDIEGAERELFQECSDWIHRVRAMVVELHKDRYSLSQWLADLARNKWQPHAYRVLGDAHHVRVAAWRTAGHDSA